MPNHRAKKKGPDLAVWACKSTVRGGGGDNQCKNTSSIDAQFQYSGAMLRCTISCGENLTKIDVFACLGYEYYA
jgi:hypothetical protein